jgi:transcriptional regulator with GAF, ATPase, and Fis domain
MSKWEALNSSGLMQEYAPHLLVWQMESPNVNDLLRQALTGLLDVIEGDFAALVRSEGGSWKQLSVSGRSQPLPWDLLSEVLDGDEPVVLGGWRVAPLAPRRGSGELLVVHGAQRVVDAVAMQALADGLHVAMEGVRQRTRMEQRVRRLEAVLSIAATWRQTLEMEPLLTQMAEAATQLLDCERASIFLWDRKNHVLIGRPALGVEGGELRIDDKTGVVGQVVQSGQSRRINAEEDSGEIDREVDRQLRFHTQSLLCIPLRGANGKTLGAFEMINKRDGRFTDDDEDALTELAAHASIALENTQQVEQLLRTRNQLADQAAAGVELIGGCPAIEALRSTVRRVAMTDLALLILGENGTGKDVVSQMIHYLSRRRHEPFIAVNCAAIAETLLESELFGHEKGAFTDARETRQGKFELASGGTLFLDEIGDMSLSGQAKLLRVLEEKVVVRVGGSTPIHTDARVIAATNQDLAAMVREKRFREDLYFRLNVVTVELPALRERGEDILLLAEHFLERFCLQARRKTPRLTAAARKKMLAHRWPGNVRELRNMMERVAYLAAGDRIEPGDLAFITSTKPEEGAWFRPDRTLGDATREFQVEFIRRQIQGTRGNMTEAARRLGLHRSNLYRKMNQLGMETDSPEENRSPLEGEDPERS